jgi:hypothetical protein
LKTLRLIRWQDTRQETLGHLLDGVRLVAYTLERPWKDNMRQVSCIPVGEYRCTWHQSPRFGWTYLVNEVPGRDAILFHQGNTVADSIGCILVGTRLGRMGEAPAVLGSIGARDAFFKEMATEPFMLRVQYGKESASL